MGALKPELRRFASSSIGDLTEVLGGTVMFVATFAVCRALPISETVSIAVGSVGFIVGSGMGNHGSFTRSSRHKNVSELGYSCTPAERAWIMDRENEAVTYDPAVTVTHSTAIRAVVATKTRLRPVNKKLKVADAIYLELADDGEIVGVDALTVFGQGCDIQLTESGIVANGVQPLNRPQHPEAPPVHLEGSDSASAMMMSASPSQNGFLRSFRSKS